MLYKHVYNRMLKNFRYHEFLVKFTTMKSLPSSLFQHICFQQITHIFVSDTVLMEFLRNTRLHTL